MSTTTRLCLLASLVSFGQLIPLPGNAQPTVSGERASILIGAFITDRESSTRLDSGSGEGTEIDLEDDLGLESSTNVARLGGYVWLGRRHRLDGSYFDLTRESTFPINETIEFGDETFTVNTVIESESKLSIIKADYTFAVLARDRGYLGLTAGLYIADTSMTLSQATLGQVESEDVTAPLPVFGLRGDYAINDRITLRGAAQWFGFESDDVDGRLTDFYVGADYGFGERMAVGVAYNSVAMDLGAIEDDGFNSRLDWGYDGFLLYFKVDLGSRN
jgi:hypothetical protein